MDADRRGDIVLVRDVLAGHEQAAEQLIRRIADTVWKACHVCSPDEAYARDAFSAVTADLRADGFKLLRSYDGRSRIEAFVALVTRNLLEQRLRDLLQQDRDRGLVVFEAFFRADIRKIISQRLPDPKYAEMRREAYQEVYAALIDKNDHRLNAASSAGKNFSGFVRSTVHRLVIDYTRHVKGRPREPQWQTPLEGEIYRLVYAENIKPQAAVLLPLLRHLDRERTISADEVTEALRGVLSAVQAAEQRASHRSWVGLELADELPDPNPSGDLIVEQIDKERWNAWIATLPPAEQLYLRIALCDASLPPPREIAREMGLPVKEVNNLKARIRRRLETFLGTTPAPEKKRLAVRLTL